METTIIEPRCVVCGRQLIQVKMGFNAEGNLVLIKTPYKYQDKKTGEMLCASCAPINEQIYRSRGRR